LRIMSIARQLDVTKGSFYWHFASLDAYLELLPSYWEQSFTEDAIACVQAMEGDARTKLRHWFLGAAASDLALDRAMRSWSLTNACAREVLTRVDEKRAHFLAKLLGATGRTKREAEILGRWSYWAFVGYSALSGPTVTEKEVDLILSVLSA
jgi:AcrR family transcriptional regulator